jgi:iron(III) transport system ATP-binding protein
MTRRLEVEDLYCGHADAPVVRGRQVEPDAVDTEPGMLPARRALPFSGGTRLAVLLRPDDAVPDPQGPLRAVVARKAFKRPEIVYTLRLDTGTTVLAMFPSHRDHAVGEVVGIRVVADHVVTFPAESAREDPDQ